MLNIFDPLINGMARSELYRACVFPDVFKHEPEMQIQNWSAVDLEMYCGIYLEGAA